jgi:hypothetical protein
MATADAVITAPTTPIRTATKDGALSIESAAVDSYAAKQFNLVMIQSSSISGMTTTSGPASTAIAAAATTAATIDTGVVSDY